MSYTYTANYAQAGARFTYAIAAATVQCSSTVAAYAMCELAVDGASPLPLIRTRNLSLSLLYSPEVVLLLSLPWWLTLSLSLAVPFQFLTNITIVTSFTKGKTFFSVYDFPVAPTSPILPQSVYQLYNIDRSDQQSTSKFKQVLRVLLALYWTLNRTLVRSGV